MGAAPCSAHGLAMQSAALGAGFAARRDAHYRRPDRAACLRRMGNRLMRAGFRIVTFEATAFAFGHHRLLRKVTCLFPRIEAPIREPLR